MGLLGECLYIESRDTEAEPFLRAALNSARASPFPLLPWQMAEVQSAVGAYLVVEGKRTEGEKLLRASLHGLKGHPQATVRWRIAAHREIPGLLLLRLGGLALRIS